MSPLRTEPLWVLLAALALLPGCKSSAEGNQGDRLAFGTGACDEGACESCSGCAPYERCLGGACSCETRCADDNLCQSDSCGGECPCPEGYEQSATGRFVPAGECHDSCGASGWVCGDLCGESCGECGSAETCDLGECDCEPSCDGTRCDDGCGGYCPCSVGTVCNAEKSCVAPADCADTCETEGLSCGSMCGRACGACADNQGCVSGICREAVSCADCPLTLSLVSRELTGGKMTKVTLAVDFHVSEQVPGPRVADFRVLSSRPVWLKKAEPGAALVRANKSLQSFPPWNDSFRRRSDGSFQVLAYDSTGSERVESGRIATLEFTTDEWGPLVFSLARREQTLAPADADAAISGSGYDGDVIVTR